MTRSALFTLVLTVCFVNYANSQEKKWEIDLKETLYQVGWIQQSNDGLIIASGAKGLLAMDNNTGKTVWHNAELKAVDKNSFINIGGLPLFYVEYAPLAGKMRGIIINSSNGDIVYDTKDDGYSIKQFTTMPDQGCILFEVMKGNEQLLMKFSLKTWKSEWVAKLGELKGLVAKAKGALKASFITQGPFVTKDNKFLIVGSGEKIACVELASGNTAWTKETGKKIKALVYSDINNSLYLGIRKSNKLTILEPATGKDITPGKLKLKGTLVDVVPGKEGNLVLVETEGFNLINPKTNELIWKKSFKIEFLDEVIPYENGYIAIGKDEKNGSIAYTDNNGKKIWDEKVKGYAYYATPTPKGVLYISTERSNIMDFKDGKDVWKKDVKFKSIPAVTYDNKENKVVLFENKKGYKFDLNTGEMKIFAEDIALENVKKSTPLVAEYTESGYFINTDQHASLLAPDGKLTYTKYFEPVSSIGVKGLMGVAQVGLAVAGVDIDIAGAVSNIQTLSMLANGAYRTSEDQNDAKSSTSTLGGLYVGSGANMAPIIEVTKTRYFNSKATRDFKFMTVKDKSSETAKNFIFRLDKKTGGVEKKIELMDKTPDYLVDEIDSRVFVNEKNHLITCYQL